MKLKRKFGGKSYTFYGTYNKKRDAKSAAERWRARGKNVRITYLKSDRQYAVWVKGY